MGQMPTVYQAEIQAILLCARQCLDKGYRHAKIYIMSDSMASLLALKSHTFKSKLTWECAQTLNTLGESNTLTLKWVPGHTGIVGNEILNQFSDTGYNSGDTQKSRQF